VAYARYRPILLKNSVSTDDENNLALIGREGRVKLGGYTSVRPNVGRFCNPRIPLDLVFYSCDELVRRGANNFNA
jgi:hypothetical protein